MDTRKIKKLIELVKETGIGELEVKSGDDSVRINCQIALPTFTQPIMPQLPATSESAKLVTATESVTSKHVGHMVKSPMVGTVYLSPAPGKPTFITIGQTVKIGDTLCLIEAMKMFNKIEADKAGIISTRFIENEQPVEYDQPLFLIEEK